MTAYRWLNDLSQTFLGGGGYLLPVQTVPDRVRIICDTAERILKKPGYGARLEENFAKGWYSFSTPVWANFGTTRGLGISCYGSHIEDDMASILGTLAEVGIMTKYGGGTSAYFGKLRGRGAEIHQNGKSSGAVHHMRLFDTLAEIVSQGSTRRGQFAAFLPIDHPDIAEFLQIRNEGNDIQLMSFGVCVPDYWMREMIDGDAENRAVWARVLESRFNTGYPYIMFTDTANRNTVDCYRDQQRRINATNLCTEIFLPTAPDESFVCDLSSMNVLYYDEWKDTDAVEVLTYLLDAVMTEFIEKASKLSFMERTAKFARRHRALGVGWLGWHSYLQSKMVPFESLQAKMLNAAIARSIQEGAWEASRKMAAEYGEPEVLEGYGRRNTTLTAIAPTKSSSFILGQVSQGIEPIQANYYIKDLAKIKTTIKNHELAKLLAAKGKDTPEVWESILKNSGSVAKLDCLTDHEKAVFKTFAEISPMEVVVQAGQRQRWVDQGQSLNLYINPSDPVKDVNALMIEGWRLGVKSFYYQKGVNAAQEFARELTACSSCEG